MYVLLNSFLGDFSGFLNTEIRKGQLTHRVAVVHELQQDWWYSVSLFPWFSPKHIILTPQLKLDSDMEKVRKCVCIYFYNVFRPIGEPLRSEEAKSSYGIPDLYRILKGVYPSSIREIHQGIHWIKYHRQIEWYQSGYCFLRFEYILPFFPTSLCRVNETMCLW